MSVERARWMLGAVAVALLAALTVVPAARADFSTLYGGDLSCSVQPANGNVRLCGGKTTTWDGETKIDVNVILPPAPSEGADGPYPVIGDFHGWGGSKIGLNEQTQGWAERGYVVFSMSDRGWGESCGSADPEKSVLNPACTHGYNHLMDDRYEVRDAQYLISVLADEGLAQPQRIGATGMSYGGGISMALAALRNRTMLPDGSLVPWKSPKGTPMELAAAVPQWPWTDLAYSLMPNGTTLDYVANSPYLGPNGNAPIGVEKASYVTGLYGLGLADSNYAAPKTDPEADLTTWYTLINAGEPYGTNPLAAEVVHQITTYHSSYYIDHGQPPAPLLIQSGWNDDLFPPDEAIRFYNRTRTQFPGDPISLFFMDDGHARSPNKPADEALFRAREEIWFDHYLKGEGPAPASSATALTTVCGGPSEGPYTADSWKDLAPGEIRFDSAAPQTILPAAGDPTIGKEFDPIATGNACATASGADQPGAASYRLPPVPGGGFTLLGSPTIIADLATSGSESELAARLLDVNPEGKERLVARGLLRPGSGGKTVFQLHPQAYRFAAGDVVKLELLPSDAPYSRPSNLQAPITVSNLELRLPVREQPGSLGGVVQSPAPKELPPGYELAAGYEEPGAVPLKGGFGLTTVRSVAATRRALLVRLRCGRGGNCSGHVSIGARRNGKRRSLARGGYSLTQGQRRTLRLPLGKGGRKLLATARRHARRLKVAVELEDAGRSGALRLQRNIRLRG
ncbi:MAG: CocE/NonD family hydrolase [Solirubrobacterales bacterium]